MDRYSVDRIAATVFELLTVIGGLGGAALLVSGLLPGNSAIQATEAAAVGIGMAVIPYCIAGVLHRGVMRATSQNRDRAERYQ